MTITVSEDHADESYNVEHLSAIALIEDDTNSPSSLLYNHDQHADEIKNDANSGIQECSHISMLVEEKKEEQLDDDGIHHHTLNHLNHTATNHCDRQQQLLLLNQYYTAEQVQQHNLANCQDHNTITSFWCCIDGFVVDATEYYQTRVHPGGQRKVLQTNDAKIGNENKPMSFSFSKGKNAHFPETARIFQDGVKEFLKGGSNEIVFPKVLKKNGDVGHGGTIYVIGRLLRSE